MVNFGGVLCLMGSNAIVSSFCRFLVLIFCNDNLVIRRFTLTPRCENTTWYYKWKKYFTTQDGQSTAKYWSKNMAFPYLWILWDDVIQSQQTLEYRGTQQTSSVRMRRLGPLFHRENCYDPGDFEDLQFTHSFVLCKQEKGRKRRWFTPPEKTHRPSKIMVVQRLLSFWDGICPVGSS